MFDTYNVHVVCKEGTRQLLFVLAPDGTGSISVYDEHTGQTLMRMCTASVSELERAIALLKTVDQDA